MKKVLILFVAVLGFAFAASAQNNAIGVRLGGGQGYNAEISFQTGLGGSNRLECDLGYAGSGYGIGAFGLSALYQPHFDINSVPNLGWYLGVGPRLMYTSYMSVSVVMLGISGQAGLDYHFDAVPIQLSLDIRPTFYFWQTTAFQWGDIALGIRYMF